MDFTICDAFLATCKRTPQATAVRHRPAQATGVEWQTVTWFEYGQTVASVAAGLVSCGVKSGHRVGILSGTRWQWAVADLAIMGIGAVSVPIYPNCTPEDLAFILNDSGASVLFCENASMAAKWKGPERQCGSVRIVVNMSDATQTPADGEMSWSDLLAKGRERLATDPDLYRRSVESRTLAEITTLAYTSGTTGQPRGAVLTQEQVMSAFRDIAELKLSPDDVSLTFLPFAHIAGRVEHFAHVYIGFCMGFAESIERLKENFLDVRPTFIASVPRMFEKIHDTAVAIAGRNAVRRSIFKWATSVGSAVSDARVEGRRLSPALGLQYRIASALVFKKLRARLGGRLRFAISGGAPLSADILRFFDAAGVLVLEAYGLTETTAAVFMNSAGAYRFGTAGKPLTDVRVRIGDDGEIFIKSAQVMKGYYNNPAATRDVLSEDGWLATGDIGEMTQDGFLKITDRKKDLIKTAGGKYVAPQKLETMLKLSPYVANVLVHGDQRPHVVALITPNLEMLRPAAVRCGVTATDAQVFVRDPRVRALIGAVVADANARLASYETIKDFALLPEDFSVESGELTPSMKVRRAVCDRRYGGVISDLYKSKGKSQKPEVRLKS